VASSTLSNTRKRSQKSQQTVTLHFHHLTQSYRKSQLVTIKEVELPQEEFCAFIVRVSSLVQTPPTAMHEEMKTTITTETTK